MADATEGSDAALKKKLKKMVSMPSRWIVLGRTGDATTLDVDRYEIVARFGDSVHARDLRILDPLLSYPSTILGRRSAIFLNLEHIKAVITTDLVLLRDPMHDHVIPVIEQLRRRLPPSPPSAPTTTNAGNSSSSPNNKGKDKDEDKDKDYVVIDPLLPFELRALEVALEGICSFLDARTTELLVEAYPALDQLTSKISSRSLDRVRKLKGAMTRLTIRVRKVKDEIERLLDDDDDMEDLCLCRRNDHQGASSAASTRDHGASLYGRERTSPSSTAARGTTRGEWATSYVEQLEMLLEAHFSQIDDTLGKLTALRKYIDDTEDYINIQLDGRRNRLIQMELFLNSGTLCLSLHSMVAGIFGMSLRNPWYKDHGYVFKWVVLANSIVCASLYVFIVCNARRRGAVGV